MRKNILKCIEGTSNKYYIIIEDSKTNTIKTFYGRTQRTMVSKEYSMNNKSFRDMTNSKLSKGYYLTNEIEESFIPQHKLDEYRLKSGEGSNINVEPKEKTKIEPKISKKENDKILKKEKEDMKKLEESLSSDISMDLF